MYPQYPEVRDERSDSSKRFKLLAGIVIGVLTVLIASIVSGLVGFWLGYRMNTNQTAAVKIDAAGPTPAPAITSSPTPEPTPTPSPTPEIAGEYKGSTGGVEISDVTDKAFTFSISVGNANGLGQIDGKASRTTPSVAVYSKIPDPELYKDPDSVYYKKKCKITFRFVGGKLKITEDDYACSYWHGAAVDFNGTFAPVKKK